jgi:hypothetical protein
MMPVGFFSMFSRAGEFGDDCYDYSVGYPFLWQK